MRSHVQLRKVPNEIHTLVSASAGEPLQLLCGHCNSVKGDRSQEYLVARLRELGIAA